MIFVAKIFSATAQFESIRSALHKSASRNPNEIRAGCCRTQKNRRLVSSAGRSQATGVCGQVAEGAEAFWPLISVSDP
jgi:hypothetical protein